LHYGCGVATAAQVNKVSSDLAALEPKVTAAAAQASSVATLVRENNQAAALRAEIDALREAIVALTANTQGLQANASNAARQIAALTAANQTAAREIAALTAQVQELKAITTNTTVPADVSQQIAALAAADALATQQLALLQAANRTAVQEITAFNNTLAALRSAQQADAAAISLANATVESIKSVVTTGAAAVAAVNTSLTNLTAILANVSAIDFSVYAKFTDLANLNAVTLGGVPAARFLRSRLVLYRESDTLRNANLGGRSGADALCNASPFRPAGLVVTHAFLSTSASDQISDFIALYGVPNSLPVESLSGVVLASNFTTILGGSIQTSLVDAGVFTSALNWWSGSTAAGIVATTCAGFASGSSSAAGQVGSSTVTGAGWVSVSFAACNTGRSVVCIAF
jgi:hypothetical protein